MAIYNNLHKKLRKFLNVCNKMQCEQTEPKRSSCYTWPLYSPASVIY